MINLTNLKKIFESYCKAGIIIVPCEDKIPITLGWNKLPTNYDQSEEIDQWFNTPSIARRITGFGVVLGHNRLGCIDVDSYDLEEVKKVWEYFAGPCNKVGKKGFTTFFISDCDQPKQGFKIKTPSGGEIEIFYKNQQTVMPPSRHSAIKIFDISTGLESDSSVDYYYPADSLKLDEVDFDDLPIYSHEKLMSIEFLLKGSSINEVNKNLPKTVTYEANGYATDRYETYKSHGYRLIGKYNDRPPRETIIKEFIAYDLDMCPKNSYFKQRYNPHRMKRGDNSSENCHDYLVSLFNFLRATYKKDVGFLEEFSIPQVSEVDKIKWNDFIPITKNEAVSEALPEDLIPEMWKGLAKDVEIKYGAPSLATVLGLFTALGACGRRYVIQPSKKASWYVHTNIATVFVAPSGSRKSDIMRICNYKASQLNKELFLVNKAEKISNIEILQSRIAGLRKIKDKKASDGELEEAKSIQIEITKIQGDLTEIGFIENIWKVENATAQKMINDMALNQKNGLYMNPPEFKTIIALMESKGNEVFRTFLMSAIDGNEEHISSTLSRGRELIERCRMSILSTTQPSVLSFYISQLFNLKKTENDGFLSRINWVSFGNPKNLTSIDDFKYSDHEFAYSIFEDVFKHGTESVVYIGPDHYTYYRTQVNALQAIANTYEGSVNSFLSKHQGLLCKVACYYEWCAKGAASLMIGRESIDKAVRFISYLRNEILLLFNMGMKEDFNAHLLDAVAMLESQIIFTGETVSKVYQKTRLGGNARMAQQIFNELERRGYVSLLRTSKNSCVINVNPEIWRNQNAISIVPEVRPEQRPSESEVKVEERKGISFKSLS